MNDYGLAIQKLRKSKNMTQGELGDKLSVSSQAVSKWENGLSQPDFDTIRKLTVIFGISIDDFSKICDGKEIDDIKEEAAAAAPAEAAKMLLGVCTECGKSIFSESDIGARSPKMVCVDCVRKEAERIEREAREKKISDGIKVARNKKDLIKSIVVPAVILVVIYIFCLIVFNNEAFAEIWKSSYFLLLAALIVLLSLAIPQIIWDEGPVAFIFDVLFKKTFSMPGVIWEWSLDGFISGLMIKLTLTILSLCVSVASSLLCIALCCLVAPFSFVPVLIMEIKEANDPEGVI